MKALLLIGLLLGSASTVSAENPSDRAGREARNVEVIQKLYPARARAAGEQGVVGFKLTLDRAGDPTACVVTQSSGHARLDDETCDLLLLHARYQPENDISRSSVITRNGQILWSLPNAVPVPASLPVRLAMADPQDKKICKKSLRTGSLASYERTCRTKREWLAESDEMKRVWEENQGKKGMTTGD